MIGTHAVTVTPYAAGATVDVTCLIDEVSIHHGRDDASSQPEANSATINLSVNTDDTNLPPELDVGATVTITTTLAGQTSTRFVGRVTDVAQGWDEAGEDTPNAAISQVIATGVLSELGRRVVGDAPWGQELDGSRVSRIMTAAGIHLDPAFSDPGTVQILARDVDSQPALDVARGTAESAGGVVWSTRAGEVRYADANHRRGTVAALQLDACDVLVTPTWSRTTSGLINQVSIGYGVPAASGGDQPRYTGTRSDSIARYGTYGFSATTELAAQADAEAMGTLLLTRNAAPVWIMADLPVDLDDLTDAETLTLLSLDMHDLLSLTGLPVAGGTPGSAFLWVEGWTERLAWGVHEISFAVSGYCRTAPAPRWNDVNPTATWDTIGTLTWDDAACFGPLPNLGRWDDVPASDRWDLLAPAITWDAWNNYQRSAI